MAPSRSSHPVLIPLAATVAAGIILGLTLLWHSPGVLAAKRSAAAKLNQVTAAPAHHLGGNPVIVELFTSEGCSSCPPADALLAKLQQDQPIPSANIITLEEHVDYWDHLGWKDRFSSPSITQRQRNYQTAFDLDDIYTPQFVVNGSSQFDGTDPTAINSAIAKAAANTAPLQITSVELRYTNPVVVRFSLAGTPMAHLSASSAGIYAAIVDSQEASKVTAGENAGHTLSHVDAVVAMSRFRLENVKGETLELRVPPGQKLHKPRIIAFVQSNNALILGAAMHTIVEKDIVGGGAAGSSSFGPLSGINNGVDPSSGSPFPIPR